MLPSSCRTRWNPATSPRPRAAATASAAATRTTTSGRRSAATSKLPTRSRARPATTPLFLCRVTLRPRDGDTGCGRPRGARLSTPLPARLPLRPPPRGERGGGGGPDPGLLRGRSRRSRSAPAGIAAPSRVALHGREAQARGRGAAARARAGAGRAARWGEPAASEARYGEEVARALRSGLERMPDDQRRVVVWRLLEGRPFAEIAGRLGTSEEACRMRFVRGLRALREEFEREGATP